ncbi:complement C1q tumor necrosis factor-related protein 4-like [Dreissena polymorpha]|uniref:C1q domain-containing protein n=1 Tax=Dreissena polymorpha TaxID=45954 RepID=A0A9D4JBM1_DREPO|nr:complement C1q tumor necrosis factor-related protein 4-like [Dreissena polymorpha]KAH3805790.1 hypothetical protein DPMN_134098 [Dreissena polymorpha]
MNAFKLRLIIFACVLYVIVAETKMPAMVSADKIRAIEERLGKVEEELKLEKERNARLSKGAGKRSYEGDAVAFFATIGASVEHLGQGQTVVFDQLLTMIDSTQSLGGYSATTGVFTAPLSGVYVFSCTIMTLDQHTTHVALQKNNTPLSTIYVSGGSGHGWDSASSTVTVPLAKGDSVSVKHMDNDHGLAGAFYGGQSTFTGFLLQRQYDDTPVVG